MLLLTLLCQIRPELLVRPFADDPGTLGVAADYLRVISWNFVGVGLTFAASGMFQALGDTRPALLASATRLLTFALPALWLAGQPGFRLHDVWLVSVASVLVQVAVSLWLLAASSASSSAHWGPYRRLRPPFSPRPGAPRRPGQAGQKLLRSGDAVDA